MDIDTWVAAIAQAPKDTLTWDAFADWCEERGDHEKAAALRLECLRARRPYSFCRAEHLIDSKLSVDWYVAISEEGHLERSYRIPTSIFLALEPRGRTSPTWISSYSREYYSMFDAYKALIDVVLSMPSKAIEAFLCSPRPVRGERAGAR